MTFTWEKNYNKIMKRRRVIVVASVLLVLVIIAIISIAVPLQLKNKALLAEIEQQAPLFPSVDFIQSWYACTLTEEDWNDYFDTLSDFGFDTVILQTTFSEDGGENIIFYESDKLKGELCYSYTLGRMLNFADLHGINVYIGTYTPYDWWSSNYSDKYIENVVDVHKILFEEIYAKYHLHESFIGWYYSPEMFSTFLGYEKQWIKLLNGVIDGIEHFGAGLPLIFSPYRGKATSPFLDLDDTFSRICSEVHFRNGDILAPQDGFGAKSPSEQGNIVELHKFAKYCSDAIAGTCLTLWINCELFSSKGQFCNQERMLQQFKLSNIFCDKTLCFSFAHYAIKAEDKTLLNNYQSLYQANKS